MNYIRLCYILISIPCLNCAHLNRHLYQDHHHEKVYPPTGYYSYEKIWPDKIYPRYFDSSKIKFKHLPCSVENDTCDKYSKYSSIDGWCNNLDKPHYGIVGSLQSRILSSEYDLGIMSMLTSSKNFLPTPREISNALKDIKPRNLTKPANLLFMVFGQFIDHDLVKVPMVEDVDCIECDSQKYHSACVPIPIPKNDKWFSQYDSKGKAHCLPFTRSTFVQSADGTSYDQINVNTAFLDLSTVYGSYNCTLHDLRLYSKGQLIEIKQPTSAYGIPPLDDQDKFEFCRSKFGKCCKAGDDRDNEHVPLLLVHTLFLREHNRIALELFNVNPHWNDETLFQEARKINIAQYQHIVYNEFLPLLLGYPQMNKYGLQVIESGYYEHYNPKVNAQIFNEFSAAAFRIGHTMIPDHFPLLDSKFYPQSSMSILDLFHDPSLLMKENNHDKLMRGLIGTSIEPVDATFVPSITDQLFQTSNDKFTAQDLIALNIARGRDHGIGRYHSYRGVCKLPRSFTWEQLEKRLGKEATDVLRTVYESALDIDLFVGGIVEEAKPGSLIGDTFSCIIAYQFLLLRQGDRFWYENPGVFTEGQLNNIRQSAKLSSIIWNFVDESTTVLPVFANMLPNQILNPLKPDTLPRINLDLWKTTPPIQINQCKYHGKLYSENEEVPVSPCLTCNCKNSGKVGCEPKGINCEEILKTEAIYDEVCYRKCSQSADYSVYSNGK